MESPSALIQTLRRRGIADERVLDAIASVDRARFVPAEYQQYAWDDNALPIAGGQTISQPYIVALMSEALELVGDETVLEIGTGSGYQAAVLCRLCERVVTIERLSELQDDAKRVLAEMGCGNILFRTGDGTLGVSDEGPYDGILVTAGAPDVPPALYDQLKEGGRLVIPVGPIEQQELLVVQKTVAGPKKRSLCGCRFVKLIGEQGWRE